MDALLQRSASITPTGQLSALASRTQCDDCGEVYSVGDWPWCKSERNPEGHQRSHYGWHFGRS